MPDGSFMFDVDTADFGYKVGEVEITFRYAASKIKESLAVLRERAEPCCRVVVVWNPRNWKCGLTHVEPQYQR